MSVNRQKQRENRRKKRIAAAKEIQLDYNNVYGIRDEVPYFAIKNIINEKRGFVNE